VYNITFAYVDSKIFNVCNVVLVYTCEHKQVRNCPDLSCCSAIAIFRYDLVNFFGKLKHVAACKMKFFVVSTSRRPLYMY